MPRKNHRLLSWLLLLGVAGALACGTGLAVSSPTPPGGAISVSAQAADALEKDVRNQIFDPSKNNFRISVTNEQATSYVNLRNTNLPLEKPQVWFSQGKVFLRGTFTAICLYHPDVLIIAEPTVRNRQIVVNVRQIYVGSFELPQDWIATVSQSITDSIAEAQLNLNFEQLEVFEGQLVIAGSKPLN